MSDDAIREAAQAASHGFLIECGLTDDEADQAADLSLDAVRPLIEADLRARLEAVILAGRWPRDIDAHTTGWNEGLETAAKIVREWEV